VAPFHPACHVRTERFGQVFHPFGSDAGNITVFEISFRVRSSNCLQRKKDRAMTTDAMPLDWLLGIFVLNCLVRSGWKLKIELKKDAAENPGK
jgi:hypothetical protein